MSYILNALRKAEKERQQKQEDLSSQLQEAKTVSTHKVMPWLILLLSVNAVFLGYLFLKSEDPGLESDVEKKIAPKQTDSVQKPITRRSSTTDSSSSLEVMFDQQKQASQIAAIEHRQETAAKSSPVIQPAEEIKTEKEMFGADEPIPEEDINFNSGRTDAEMPKMTKQSTVSAPQVSVADAQEPIKSESFRAGISAASASISAPPERRAHTNTTPIKKEINTIPWVHELPRDFRRLVPDVHINVYVYNDQPENRFIMIDMKKYKTGQEITPDMMLREIQADGIVVQFREKRFKIKRR